MAASRLNTAETFGAPITNLIEWCQARNSEHLTRRMGRWYFVDTVDGRRRATFLDGTDGDNAWAMVLGKLDDFAGWPKSRMDGYRRWLSGCIEHGGGALA